jgi:DNA polymerase-3 subunit gamma/tau
MNFKYIKKVSEQFIYNFENPQIGKVELWDFSKSNICEEAKQEAVATVASISYGNGTVMTKDIKAMLGLVHHDDILALATHLFNQDAEAVINFVKELSHKGEDLSHALKDLTSLFHQISIAQIIDNTQISNEIKALAMQISNQDLQLFYHMAINGSKDMPLAPSEQIGFEMTLLRMLAFHSDIKTTEKKTLKLAENPKTKAIPKGKSPVEPKLKAVKTTELHAPESTLNINSQQQWEDITKSLKFNTASRMLLKNTLFDNASNQTLTLNLDEQFSSLLTDNIQRSIQTVLQANFGEFSLQINLKKLTTQTLAQKETQANNEKIATMQKNFMKDEGVKKLQQTFNAKVDLNSIKEIENV